MHTHEGTLCFCVSNGLFLYNHWWPGNNLWQTCNKAKEKKKNPTLFNLPLPFSLPSPLPSSIIPFFFSTTSLAWPRGAVSCLDAGTLLWALIDFPSAPRSQSGQSAWGPVLSCDHPVNIHRNTEEKWRKGMSTNTKTAAASIKAVQASRGRQSYYLLSLLPCFCRSAPRSSHSQKRSMVYSTRLHLSCFKIVLFCFFSTGEDPFTDPTAPQHIEKINPCFTSSNKADFCCSYVTFIKSDAQDVHPLSSLCWF